MIKLNKVKTRKNGICRGRTLGDPQNGITLISLVVTIVVLVILSAVAIYLTLGDNGILNKAEQAKNETTKQTATEKINLKITNMQIEKYAKEQRMPTLQEFADGLCEDDEIQYVQLQSKKVGSLSKIEIGNATSIFTKLKEYPYEFEINSSLQLASIDGIQVATGEGNNESKLITNIDFTIKDVTNKIISIAIDIDENEKKDGIVYFVLLNSKVITGGTDIEYTISDLNESTKYKMQVGVIDVDCNFKLSAEKEVETNNNKYLYAYGNNYVEITGGWNYAKESNCNIDLNSYKYMIGTSTVGNACMGSIYTSNKIDLTEYSKLCALIYAEPGHYEESGLYPQAMGVSNSISTYMTVNNAWTKYVSIIYNGETNVYTVDISSLNSSYYIQFSQYLKLKIYKVWLEK